MAQLHQGRFIQDGLMIDHTPGGTITAGDVVVQNNVIAIAKNGIAANKLGALAISGIFDVVKENEAFNTVGANVFWDATGDPYNGTGGSGALTATPGGNTWMGFVIKTAGATDETVRILLRNTVSLTAEEFSLADLSDIGAISYTDGRLLIADGDSFEDQALTGPFALAGTGLLSVKKATVAALGSSQGDAAAITDGFTLVSAADGTKGVELPAAVGGELVFVKNNANSVLLLYPNTDDAIDALGANNALSIPAYGSHRLIAYDATTWYTEDLSLASLVDIDAVDYTAGDLLIGDGSKYADVPLSGPFTLASSGALSVKVATVAAAGSSQGDAAAITDGFTLVSAADATKGVELPTAVAGLFAIVKNNVAQILKLYPNSSDQINEGGANVNLAVPASTSVMLVAYDAEHWYSIPLLPS